MAWTAALTSSQRARNAALSMSGGWLRLSGCCRRRDGRRRTGRAPGISARHRRARPRRSAPAPRDRHRDVVLDRAALDASAPPTARGGCARTPPPARATAARDAVLDQALRPSPRRRSPRSVASASACERRRRDLEQHVPGVAAGERIARAGQVAEDDVDADARHQSRRRSAPLPAWLRATCEERQRRRRVGERRRRRR